MICDACGRKLKIGDWPFCPHPDTKAEGMGMLGEFHPYFDEHISEQGAWITSLGQRKQLMRDNKLDHHGRKVGNPHCEI